jgi:uncharacterized protein with HEPN domain
LEDMIYFARHASLIADHIQRRDLETRLEFRYALERLVSLIGEAAKRIPRLERNLHPQIPWTSIVGMRDKLVHDYNTVNLDILWETVTENVPRLINQLEAIMARRHRR